MRYILREKQFLYLSGDVDVNANVVMPMPIFQNDLSFRYQNFL